MLKHIMRLWYSFSYYHHYICVFINIIEICLFTGFIHFLLNKLINNFSKIYSKYNKSQTPPTLLEELIKISKQPLIVLIWFFCSIAVIEILVERQHYIIDSFKLFGGIIIITWLSLKLLQQIEEYLINFVYKGEHKNFRRHKTTIIAVWRLLKILIVIFAFLMVMQALHVDITGIVALGSASTIVLGLAAKELLANFFGGMMIFMDQHFMVGDSIKSINQSQSQGQSQGGIEGVVEYIGWRLTRIRTSDKSLLYVPNSTFLTISVENTSRRYNHQIKEVIRLKYQDLQKINLIIDDLSNMLKAHPGIDLNQLCFVGLNRFNYMAADCLVWCFTKATDLEGYLKVQHDVLYKISVVVAGHGVEIASNILVNNP
jgi:MscS family membrane protein